VDCIPSRRLTPNDIDGASHFLQEISDVPSLPALHTLAVNRVGIAGRAIILQLNNLLDQRSPATLYCTVDAYVDLPGSSRGIHISRIQEVISQLVKATYPSVEIFASSLAEEVGNSQTAQKAYVHLNGTAIHEKATPMTQLPSSRKVHLLVDTEWDRTDGVRQHIGVQAYNVTACPCTLAYSRYAKAIELAKMYSLEIANELIDNLITYSHSQRGLVTLLVEQTGNNITMENLLTVLEGSTELALDVLKRPDEHKLTERVYARAQFTEDVIRDTFVELAKDYFSVLRPDTNIRIESRVFESIHTSDVHSVLEGEFKELMDQLTG